MMFSTSFIAAAAASLSITPFVSALYDAKAHDNVAVYYGQGHNQPRLKQFCQSSDIDVIPIGFINSFPAQANGLVGVNFGNQCWGGFSTYPGPGYNGALQPENDKLFVRCPALQEDIHFCQTVMNKTILLSVGGAIGDYDLSSENEGEDLADFLWKAYGPYDQEYVDRGGIRPLDRGYFNVDSTKRIDIDGFDFDIQRPASGGQAAYTAAINRLRYHYNLHKYFYPTSKTYLISGSPQCPLHDNQMDEMITEAKFDLLFIQYYNNGLSRSTARNFLDGTGRFNFNQWADFVNTGRSKGAKLYVGLLGSPEAGTAGDYVTPAEVKPLILTYRSHPQFGGVMIWDATHAKSKVLFDSREMSYYQAMKTILRIPPPRVIPTRVGHRTTRASSSSDQTYTPSQQATSNSVPSHPNLTSAVSSYKPSSSSSVHVSGTVSSSSGGYSYPAPTEGTAYSNHSSSSSSRTASVQGYPYESSTAVSSTRSVVSGYVTPSSPPTYSAGVRVNSSAIYATGSSHAASGSVHSSSPPTYSAGVRVNSSAIYATGSSYAASGPVHTRILPVHPTGKYANSSSVQNPPVPTGGYGIAPIGTPTPECSMSCGIGNDSSKCCKSNDPSSECPGGVCPFGSSESNSPSKCPGGVCPYGSSESNSPSKCPGGVCPFGSSEPVTGYKTSPKPPSNCPGGVCPYGSSESNPPSKCSGGGACSMGSSESITGFKFSPTPLSKCLGGGVCSLGSSESVTGHKFSPTPLPKCSGEGVCSLGSSEPIAGYKTSPHPPSKCSGGVCPFGSSEPSLPSKCSGGVCPFGSSKPSPPSKCPGGVCPFGSSVPGPKYTMSTVWATNVETITWCPPTVPNCSLGSVTTKTVAVSTTVCPVTTTPVSQHPTRTSSTKPTTTPVSSVSVPKYTTSVVYKTSIYTITSCPPAVPECTAKLGHVVTETIKISTTVCPVTESEPTKTPTGPAAIPPAYQGVPYDSTPEQVPAGGEDHGIGGGFPSYPEGDEHPSNGGGVPSYPEGGEHPNNGGGIPSYPEGNEHPSNGGGVPSYPEGDEHPSNGGGVPSYPEGGKYPSNGGGVPSYPEGGKYPSNGGGVPSYPEGDEYPPSTSTLKSTATIYNPAKILTSIATVIPTPQAPVAPYPYEGGSSGSYPAAPYPYEGGSSASASAPAPPGSTASQVPFYPSAASSSKSTIGLVVAFAAAVVAYLI